MNPDDDVTLATVTVPERFLTVLEKRGAKLTISVSITNAVGGQEEHLITVTK